jgi:hypothetical protein
MRRDLIALGTNYHARAHQNGAGSVLDKRGKDCESSARVT